MNTIEFQNSKIELAKLVLDIKNEALLLKVQNCINEEKMNLENKRNFEKREARRDEIRNSMEDDKGVRTISANDFVIKLS